jgi:YegS/Rv2252/BmrU family lipid kinase
MIESAIRARLITNPRSGRGGVDLSGAMGVLREHGWDVSVRQKLHGGHATELAREAAREGCQVVVDCGGDGTLNELVEGVLGTETAVGVLPGGTANLWAHEVGIVPDLTQAAMQLVDAERRRVDVGQVIVNSKHKNHFVLMAGVGLDGAIIERVNKPLKNRIGPAAVGLAALQALPSATAVPARIEIGDLHWHGRLSQLIVSNTRRYGGFTAITADAFADDGLFDVCLITATNALGAARAVGSFLLQRRPSPSVAQYYRAARVSLRLPYTLSLQVDGGSVSLKHEEPTAEGVLYEFSLLARGVTMLVPKTYDGSLFQPALQSSLAPGPTRTPVPLDGAAGETSDARSKKGKRMKKGKNGHKKDHDNGHDNDHDKRWRVTTMEVGVDSLTAARVKNGRVYHIKVAPETTYDDGTGVARPLLSALSLVTVGEELRVTGHKSGKNHTILARHIATVAAPNGHMSATGARDTDEA